MSDHSANRIFKILGFFNLISSLVSILTILSVAIGSTTIFYAKFYIEKIASQLGENGSDHSTKVVAIFFLFMLVSAGLNAASSVGFLKLKSWQPKIFATLQAFTILNFLASTMSDGLRNENLLAGFSVALSFLLFLLVWNKKYMFKN